MPLLKRDVEKAGRLIDLRTRLHFKMDSVEGQLRTCALATT